MAHISTAYVNSNRPGGIINEEIYEPEGGQDSETTVNNILSLNPQQVIDKEKELIGTYPNTYTFTKSLAERTLKKRHGQLRLIIMRPSIVLSSYIEPVLGWTETLSAGGGVVYAVMMGMTQYLYMNKPDLKFCIVPVDFVSNLMLCSVVHTATSP